MKGFRIRSKLWLNITITVICLVAVGGIGLFYTHHVANISMSLVDTEAIPILKLDELEKSTWEVMQRVVVHTSVADVESMQQLEREIAQWQEKIAEQIVEAEQLYQAVSDSAGHQQVWQSFLANWQQLNTMTQQVLKLSQDFAKEEALDFMIRKGIAKHQQAIVLLRETVEDHRKHMTVEISNAVESRQQAALFIVTLTLLIGTATAFFIIRFGRNLLTPLLAINEHLKFLAQGKLVSDDVIYQGTDEIAEIVKSVKQVKTAIQSTIEQTNAIATGNYNSEINLLSEEDQLGQALVEMTNTLRNATAKNARQDWLKTGQAQLSDRMSGEQEIKVLAKNIITFLTTYLDAKVGLFYLIKEMDTDEQPTTLYLAASYAYTPSESIPTEYLVGEGLVGQAALEGRMLTRLQAPEESTFIIQSGLSRAVSRYVVIMPFLYENVVIGIIELGAADTLTELMQEFLIQAMPGIGIAVNTALSRTKMQVLLERSQRQTKQMQLQAEELKARQIEMQQVNEQLFEQQEQMKQVNEELQSQTEELQSQQEELRQTNEELEERTRDLEQQREAIREKNAALEKTQADMEQAKQAIEEKAKELELASKYKSEFLANMSHELRTPLNSLLILAQLLSENKTGNLTEKQQEYARTIHSAGSDLLTLINEILDLSKVEAGRMEAHIEHVVLADLMSTIEPKFRHMAEKKRLDFHIDLAKELPATISTDVQRLKQVINNLLSNAFKFTTQGQIRVEMRLPSHNEEVAAFGLVPTEAVAISVMDTGIGIPKDKQRLIFEAFQQADGTTSRRYGGTGLGLSISRQLARLLGGELRLYSEEGKGSTFVLYLPVTLKPNAKAADKPDQPSQVDRPEQPSQPEFSTSSTSTDLTNIPAIPPPMMPSSQEDSAPLDDRQDIGPGDKFILIVEDDRKFSNILMELAKEKGFKCIVAEDGKTGLQLAEEYRPHAIVLDVGLPKVNGWTVMERLKDNPAIRHIPVHFMSATDQSLDARKMGAIGYLLKPVNMEQLGKAFKKIEQFLSSTAKNLLVVVDDTSHEQKILDLLSDGDVKVVVAATRAEAYTQLTKSQFDCIVLDVDVEKQSGIQLLEQIYREDTLSQIPVIVYTDRELSKQEDAQLQQYTDFLAVKAVRSPERLLDEATLFLHQLEEELPQEKRQMLQMVHDKTAILMNKKVLVVDDDIRNTFALTTVLEDKEMEVVVAKNGKEALTLLDKHTDVNIVLMDIMMPEMDGYEAIQKIRKQDRFRKLPIIALTAKAMKGDKAKCIEAGANDYLSKPVDTDKLISLMRVWLYR